MATPPDRDNTLLDMHAADDDAGSQGALTGNEREERINVLSNVTKLEGGSANSDQKCASNTAKLTYGETSFGGIKFGCCCCRHCHCCCCASRLPNPHKHFDCMVNHQVEAGIPRTKQETNPQSSLVKANIPVTTQATVLPLTNATDTGTTRVNEKTPSIQNFDDEEIFFQTLSVSNASQLLCLPPKLQSLRIKGCESLDVLPDDLLDGLPNLKELELMNCSDLRSIPYPPSLTELYIRKCRNFELLPSLKSRENLSFIHSLSIGSSCNSLTILTLNLFPKLKILSIWNCPNLVSFDVTGVYKGDFPLECFEIKDCPGLTSFPDERFHTPNLHTFSLSNCKNLHKFPNFIASLTSLLALFVLRCPHIECFPHGGLPSSLILLSIAYCDKLTSQKEWGLENLKSLTTFNIEGGCIGLESFPEENLLPRNIISLHISNLKSLKKLDNKGFQQLNALRTLKIDRCDVLQYLPEQGLPSSLNQLYNKERGALRRIGLVKQVDGLCYTNNLSSPKWFILKWSSLIT